MHFLENPEYDAQRRDRSIAILSRLLPWLLATAVIAGGYGLAINLLGRDVWFQPQAGLAETSPATLVCIVLLAGAIWHARDKDAVTPAATAFVLMAVVTALGVSITQLMLSDVAIREGLHGLMGGNTALIIALLACTVQLRRRRDSLGMMALLGALGLLLSGGIGASYGLPYFGGHMATMSFVAFSALTLGAMSLFAHRPAVQVVLLASPIGQRTRIMMFVGFIVPWLCGYLLYSRFGVPQRTYPVEALMITCIIWSMGTVAITSGYLNERADGYRRAAERKLAQQAVSDQLTGLLNRAGLMRRLDVQWRRLQRRGEETAVILMDLDHFKQINDQHGHDMGDKVLAAAGRALAPFLRKNDALGRWGGEEFLFLIERTDLHDLAVVSERLRNAVLGLTDTLYTGKGDARFKVSASFGVSVMRLEDDGFDAAIKRADEALYAAKAHGRNRVVFDPALRAAAA